MTDKEVRKYVDSEYARSFNISDKKEARQIRYRAKVIFDKRFPIPDICLCCNQKIYRGL